MTHPNNLRNAKNLVGGEMIQYNAAPTPNDPAEWVCAVLDNVQVYTDTEWGFTDKVYLFPHNRPMLVVSPETIITVVDTEYDVYWPGYSNSGNDLRGHLHPHSEGTHFVQTGGMNVPHGARRGFYCAAPLNDNGKCIDPPPAYLEAMSIKSNVHIVELGSNPDTGGRFMYDGYDHTIIGFYTGNGFVHLMYTFNNRGVFEDSTEKLQFVQVWQQVGNTNKWERIHDSEMTVLDCVSFAHKNDGRF